MTTYDVHAHCAPPAFLDALARDGDRYGTEVVDTDRGRALRFAGGLTTPALRADLSDLAHRLATMDAGRVDVQLVSPWVDLTAYSLPSTPGVRYARMLNEALAELVASHPDRLRGLCTAPLQDPSAAAKELRHAVTALDMVGVEIATAVDGRDLDDPALDPFWGEAADMRCPVLIHPYASLAGRHVSRHFLNNLVGNPAESTVAIAHVIFGGVLERHPELRLVMVHGGGFAPWQVGRWDRGYEAVPHLAATNLTRPPSAWLRQVHVDTVLHDPTRVAALVDLMGADRVVVGTDYPFPMGDLTPVAMLDAIPDLSAADRGAILSGNVQSLLDGVRR